jgi:beta-phosphoglucomutase
MNWIKQYQLFLFDFDGLLVNTEQLHYEAYITMCQRRGYILTWDFEQFCKAAHVDATAIRNAIYADFPDLLAEEPRWEVLYAEKKKAYMEILRSGRLQLLPGVSQLLAALEKEGIRRCVATHSPLEQINYIRSVLPELNSIPHWVTREDYTHPKPSPDAYLTAIKKFGQPGDAIIGFEDSLRGLTALRGTPARAVLICPASHPQSKEGFTYFETFDHIPHNFS